MRYIVINEGPSREQRRKSSHDSRNREARRKSHRMNRPERLELVSAGHIKLCNFFKIKH